MTLKSLIFIVSFVLALPLSHAGERDCDLLLGLGSGDAFLPKLQFSYEEKIQGLKETLDSEHELVLQSIAQYHNYDESLHRTQIKLLVKKMTPYFFPGLPRDVLDEGEALFPTTFQLKQLVAELQLFNSTGQEVDANIAASLMQIVQMYNGVPDIRSVYQRTLAATPRKITKDLAETIVLDEILYQLKVHGVLGAVGPISVVRSTTYPQLRALVAEEEKFDHITGADWYLKIKSLSELKKHLEIAERELKPKTKRLAEIGTLSVLLDQDWRNHDKPPVIWPAKLVEKFKKAMRNSSYTKRNIPSSEVAEALDRLIAAKWSYDRYAIESLAAVYSDVMFNYKSDRKDANESRMYLNSALYPVFSLSHRKGLKEPRELIEVKFFDQIGSIRGERDLLSFLESLLPAHTYSDEELSALNVVKLRVAISIGGDKAK